MQLSYLKPRNYKFRKKSGCSGKDRCTSVGFFRHDKGTILVIDRVVVRGLKSRFFTCLIFLD